MRIALDVDDVVADLHTEWYARYNREWDESQREDVRGRIKDARVYLALLRGMIEENDRAGS